MASKPSWGALLHRASDPEPAAELNGGRIVLKTPRLLPALHRIIHDSSGHDLWQGHWDVRPGGG